MLGLYWEDRLEDSHFKISFRQDRVAVETQFHTFMKRMTYFIEKSSKYYRRYTFEIWEDMLEATFPLSHMAHFIGRVINMSLEELLEEGLFCHCWPVVANVCKSLQNLAVVNP